MPANISYTTLKYTHWSISVTNRMASTATSYSLSSVIDTMRSWKAERAQMSPGEKDGSCRLYGIGSKDFLQLN